MGTIMLLWVSRLKMRSNLMVLPICILSSSFIYKTAAKTGKQIKKTAGFSCG
jgi:hypothetical protein